jgi:PAS domain S-box/PAS domain S-box/PAS domain S-box/PAS domain S-box
MKKDTDNAGIIKEEANVPLGDLASRKNIIFQRILIAVFIFLVANIIAFGYISYQNYSKHFQHDRERELATIADMKANEISQYLRERLGNGGMLFERDTFYNAVRRFLEDPADSVNTEYLKKWMARYGKHYQYDNAIILDTLGAVRLSVEPIGGISFCSNTVKSAFDCLEKGEVMLDDFHRDENDGKIYLAVLVPILPEDDKGPALGVLVLRIDPAKYLYPFIEKWPVPSDTAETLLVRREGNDVVFLNELRFKKNTALSLRFPIDSNKDLPSAKAALGQKGIMEGLDYRKVPVIAYVRDVPNSPWLLVARVDKSEAFAPMRRQLLNVLIIIIIAIIAIGMTIWFIWRRSKLVFYKAHFKMAQDLRISEESYRRLFEAAQDAVLILDFETGMVLDANPFFLKLTGYSLSEIHKKYIWDIGPIKNIIPSKDNFQELCRTEYIRYEDQPLETKSGNVAYVEFISNVYIAGGKKVIQCNIRDITERKKVEAEAQRLASVVRHSSELINISDLDGKMVFINEAGSRMLGISAEEVTRFNIMQVIPAHLKEKVDKELMPALLDTGGWSGDLQYINMKTGKLTDVHAVTFTVKDPDSGKPLFLANISLDITERKTAQAELQENALRIKTLNDNLTLGMVYQVLRLKDGTRKFTYLSDAVKRLYGCTPADAMADANKIYGKIHSEDIDQLRREEEKAHLNMKVFKSEVRVIGPDGNTRWSSFVATPRFMEDGSSIWDGIEFDITVRKQLEEDLAREKETQYRTLVESLPQKVYLKNRRSVYLSCNANFAKDLKIRPEEIVGKTDHDLFPTYLAEKYRLDDKRVMDSGQSENIEEEFMVIKDFLRGAQKSIINTVKVPIYDTDGYVSGIFGIFWDITERKKNEEAVRDLNKQIEFVLGATHTGLDIIDADFNMVYIDPEWKKVYGEHDGKKCYEYFMDRDEECPNCGVRKAFDTKETVVTEEVLAKEGNRIVQVTSMPFQDKDGNWLVAEVNVDITERKRLEEELRQADALRSSTEIKSKFTSMVSHELRSPMSVIKESINLVLEGLVGSVSVEQKDVLETAKNNIDRLSRLINNVLDFQKIEAGRMDLNIKEHELNNIVQATSKGMNILAQEKGLGFTVDLDEKIGGVMFDKDKISQVLTNLLSNAIKFTDKGSISVSTRHEDGVVHVIVEDTGTGIQAEDIPKLFHTFEQLNSGAGRKKGGTGLGLAISKEIILAHNGKIWAASEFGKGSKFHFTLPVK